MSHTLADTTGADDELPAGAPYAPSRARVLLALADFVALEQVAWYQARAVYLAIVESFLGLDVRNETEQHIIDGIQGSEQPLAALAVFCDSTIRCWGRDQPAIVEPLRQLAAKLDPEHQGRRSMLDASEPPGCLAGGVTTRADVAPQTGFDRFWPPVAEMAATAGASS